MSFKYFPLGSLLQPKGYIRGPFGSALKRQELQSEGVPVYEQQQAIRGHRDFRFFIDEAKHKELRRFSVRPNDLIISCSGTVGCVSIISELDPIGIISQALLILRPNTTRLLPSFLYYFLISPKGQAELLNASHGAVQLNIAPRNVVEKIDTPAPSLQEQQAIIAMLGALDGRISLLRKTNQTLESIAQAIFKSWFVDFDPVRAKMEGRQPEGMDEETAALFPDSLEESNLGLIPKGWATAPFYDTIQIIGGGTPKTSNPDYWEGSIPWYSVVDAPTETDVFVIDTAKKITKAGLEGSSTKLLPQGTTIISARGTVGKLALTGCEMAMNQSCYGLRGLHNENYFTYFSTKRLVDRLKQQAHGSVFDTITQATFKSIITIKPPLQTILHYEKSVENIMERIQTNLVSTSAFAELRDTLLPRLISGQLRLPEAQEQVESALS